MLLDLATTSVLLGITDQKQYRALSTLIHWADAAVKRYLDRDIEQTTYPGAAAEGTGDSGYYSGDDTRFLLLRQYPVSAVASVYSDSAGRWGQNPDGSFQAATLLIAGTNYALDLDGCLPGTSTPCSYKGILRRTDGVWPAMRVFHAGVIRPEVAPGNGNLKVAYTAGYPQGSIPADITGACFELVGWMRKNMKRGGQVDQENLGAYGYTMTKTMLGSMPELGSTRQLLARHRRVSI